MRGGDLEHRFWSYVDKQEDHWWWVGSRLSSGYGRIMVGRKLYLAHRLAVEIRDGIAPPLDRVVRHSCDLPFCVHFDHLLIGTQSENILDAVNRGRYKKNRGGAVLSPYIVLEIRRRLAEGETTVDLAREHGVCRETISDIKRNRTWNG